MTGKKSRIVAIAIAVVMTVTMMPFGAGLFDSAAGTQMKAGMTAQAKTKKQPKYWLKINRQRGVVTAYKLKGKKWVPVRAMLTSVGKGYLTPLGTFHLQEKYRWKLLMLDSKAQFCSRITGGILFHSVCYNQWSKSSQQWWEFNKLGHKASHGCCRLSCIDAKWVYDNVKSGSKVTIYDSSKAGPLGKPKAIKSYSGWDPTDPSRNNPNYKLRKAILKISKNKKKTVAYGKKYSLKKGVKAYNPNANESLKDQLKIIVKKRVNGKWMKAKFSTKKPGTYKITYKIDYKYCAGPVQKSLIIKVKKKQAKKKPAEEQTQDQTQDQTETEAGTETGTGE